MAQKLIIVSGSPCVGKTTAAKILYERFDNSAYLDGDWCWCVHPFSLEDPRLREGDKAMSAVLSNYLRLGFDYVVFSSVVAMYENVRQGILGGIAAEGYEVLGFTLTCGEETLRQRHRLRGDQTQCSFEWLRLPPYPGDHVIYTDGLTPAQVAARMKEIIDAPGPVLSAGPLLLRVPGPEDLGEIARVWDMDQGPISRDEAERVLARMVENHRKNRPGHIRHLCLAVVERQHLHRLVRPGRHGPGDAAPVLLHRAVAPGPGLCHPGSGGPAGLRLYPGPRPFYQRRLRKGQPRLLPGDGKAAHEARRDAGKRRPTVLYR